ncbi:Heat shock protein 70 [Entamoeba marina]
MAKQQQESIGIDLGTTFCSCAYYDYVTFTPEIIAIDKKSDMPSWINMCEFVTSNTVNKKACLIGNGAKDSEFSEYALYDNKRIIGRKLQEVKIEDKGSWPFTVVKKGDSLAMVADNPVNEVKIELLPEQVAALLLKKVYAFAKKTRSSNIGSVVIAVPAQFNDRQRQATLKAAKIARIEVKSLINEPVAALLAYKSSFPDDFANVTYSVVFDFGGGTLDVAVCENIEDDIIDVVKCGGDQNLGGNDFDLVLINIIKERILEEYPEGAKYFEKQNRDTGTNKKLRKQVLVRVKKAAEKVKIELSEKTMANIPIDDIFKGILNKEDIENIGEIAILREDFEEGCKELFEKCEDCLIETIKSNDLTKADIDKVVLVGGSSKIPKIREIIKKYFNNENIICNNQFNPLTAVAKGAAIYARDLSYDSVLSQQNVINRVPHSIGVEIAQSKFSPIIDKDSVVPAEGSQVLTLKPGVKQSTIRIYQGECEFVSSPKMQYVKMFKLMNTSETLTAIPVRVTFKFNGNGIIEATAKVLNDENNEASVSVEMKNLEYDEDIEECRKEINKIMPDDF